MPLSFRLYGSGSSLPSLPKTALTAGLLLIPTLGCQPQKSMPPQRVVLVTIDTLRADHLGMYGYPRNISPFLDELAGESVRFDNAYASSSNTMPSHTSLFTSLFPAQHGTTKNGDGLHDGVLTMAEVFHDHGYATAGFSTVGFLSPLGRGFDVFEPKRRSLEPASGLVDEAVAWLESLPPERPFFLWLHLFDVHQWMRPKFLDPRQAKLAEATSSLSPQELIAYWHEQQGIELDPWDSEDDFLLYMNRYDGQILLVDAQLRRLYDVVQSNGLLDQGLWVVTADHGEGLGSHGLRGHGARIYDEQLRVPLLLHFADGRYAGTVVRPLVRHVDLLPTLAELLGVDLDRQVFPVAGRSLLPLLEGHEPESENRYAYGQRREPDETRLAQGWEEGDMVSLQNLRRKYIFHSHADDEFFDLENDPLELRNLAGTHSREEERLRVTLQKMLATMKEQGGSLGDNEIQPEFIEELRALGYL